MTNQRKKLGAWGENLAARYLEAHGYTILVRGWRCRAGEIDLIAQHDDMLVFVEVRTRRGDQHGTAEESITPSKAARLIELANEYLLEREEQGDPWNGAFRIDVIAITLDQRGVLKQINHVESAVEG